MAQVLNHQGPTKCPAKARGRFYLDILWVVSNPKNTGTLSMKMQDGFPPVYVQMGFVVVAMSPLLDAPAQPPLTPQEPPWPCAGWGREINMFSHLRNVVEREESYFKIA